MSVEFLNDALTYNDEALFNYCIPKLLEKKIGMFNTNNMFQIFIRIAQT